MGLSKPRASRKVERMKRIPSKLKIEATRSVICIALSWLLLNVEDMMSGSYGSRCVGQDVVGAGFATVVVLGFKKCYVVQYRKQMN